MTRRLVLAFVLLALALPSAGFACSVCYGDSDSTMAQGMNNGILVLLGVVGVVQGGLVALFLSIRRRARRLQEHRESFRLIEGGVR